MRSKRTIVCDEGGAVMMEYIIVIVWAAVVLMFSMDRDVFSFAEGSFGGLLGTPIVQMYERVVAGIALPTP